MTTDCCRRSIVPSDAEQGTISNQEERLRTVLWLPLGSSRDHAHQSGSRPSMIPRGARDACGLSFGLGRRTNAGHAEGLPPEIDVLLVDRERSDRVCHNLRDDDRKHGRQNIPAAVGRGNAMRWEGDSVIRRAPTYTSEPIILAS